MMGRDDGIKSRIGLDASRGEVCFGMSSSTIRSIERKTMEKDEASSEQHTEQCSVLSDAENCSLQNSKAGGKQAILFPFSRQIIP